MPGIRARYDRTEVTGYNASDRTGSISSEAPSIKIKQYATKLGNFMDALNKENGRSAYACAEAQALALLLGLVGDTIDFSQIEFSVPTSDSGLLLWHPCKNCGEWMEFKNGWGPSRKYKLNAAALKLVPSTPSTSTSSFSVTDYDKEFPKLK